MTTVAAPTNLDRFLSFVTPTDDDACWLWQGPLNSLGYASFAADGQVRGHAWSYRAFVGPVPSGLHLDHVCHSRDLSCPGGSTCLHRSCVNPDHLEPVTPAENTRRGRGHGKETHCPQGHPYDGDNLYVPPGRPRRVCRTCRDARIAVYKPKMTDDKHGTLTGYTYGCRCESCLVAGRAYYRERRRAERAAKATA